MGKNSGRISCKLQSLLLYISHPLRTYTTLDILYILRYTDTLLSLKL